MLWYVVVLTDAGMFVGISSTPAGLREILKKRSSALDSPQKNGEQIAKMRRAANLTQEELGTQVGVSRSLIAQWETGRSKPDGEQLTAIYAACNVSDPGSKPRKLYHFRLDPKAADALVREVNWSASRTDLRELNALLRQSEKLCRKMGMVGLTSIMGALGSSLKAFREEEKTPQIPTVPASRASKASASKSVSGTKRAASTKSAKQAQGTAPQDNRVRGSQKRRKSVKPLAHMERDLLRQVEQKEPA